MSSMISAFCVGMLVVACSDACSAWGVAIVPGVMYVGVTGALFAVAGTDTVIEAGDDLWVTGDTLICEAGDGE